MGRIFLTKSWSSKAPVYWSPNIYTLLQTFSKMQAWEPSEFSNFREAVLDALPPCQWFQGFQLASWEVEFWESLSSRGSSWRFSSGFGQEAPNSPPARGLGAPRLLMVQLWSSRTWEASVILPGVIVPRPAGFLLVGPGCCRIWRSFVLFRYCGLIRINGIFSPPLRSLKKSSFRFVWE